MRLRFLTAAVINFCLFAFAQMAFAAPPDDVCNLPQDLQREISRKYPGSKLVSLSDLDEYDRKLFQKDHGKNCPGLVRVDFYGDGKPTLALVLIAGNGAQQKAELVVARQIGENWRTTLLDMAGSSIPVVWRQKPGSYTDVYGKKTIKATRSVIVFCGYESWAILYAWTGQAVTKIWLSD